MVFELVELRVPESLIVVNPPCDFSQRLGPKRDQNFAASPLALDQSSSLEDLEVLRYRVQRRIERFGDIEKPGWPVRRELSNDGASRRMRDGRQHTVQLIHVAILHHWV